MQTRLKVSFWQKKAAQTLTTQIVLFVKFTSQKSGLDKIARDPAARTKRVLTKPLTAKMSAKLNDMIGLSHSSDDHHEAGASSIAWDVNYVQIVKAFMQCTSFSLDSESLMNIMTGHHATPQVQTHLLSETWALLH